VGCRFSERSKCGLPLLGATVGCLFSDLSLHGHCTLCVCVSLFYVIDTGSIGPRARIEMGVTYLPFTISSDAGYADLPLPLLGAPVSIEALVKLGSRSLAKQDRD
jgi:hypothetical protein